MGNIIDFISKHSRYFGAGVVGLLMVFMLAVGIDAMGPSGAAGLGGSEHYTDETKNEELTALIAEYYRATDENDVAAIKAVAQPITDSELSYIAMKSDYYDSHDIVSIYSMEGVDEGSYLVSVYTDLNFAGQKSPAPGLDFFYVETDPATGELVINNAYCFFNQENLESPMDPAITALIDDFEKRDEVLDLRTKVQKDFNSVIKTDNSLNTFIKTTLQSKINEWASEYQQERAVADAERKAAEEEARAAEEAAQKEAAEQAAAEQAAAEQAAKDAASAEVATISSVNVRKTADETGALLGQLPAGFILRKYRDEGSWSVINFKDNEGYIRSDFLTSVLSSAERKVTLSETVNVRAEMNENAQKVALAYANSEITVLCDYGNGWSKVDTGNGSGFAKTEYLR